VAYCLLYLQLPISSRPSCVGFISTAQSPNVEILCRTLANNLGLSGPLLSGLLSLGVLTVL